MFDLHLWSVDKIDLEVQKKINPFSSIGRSFGRSFIRGLGNRNIRQRSEGVGVSTNYPSNSPQIVLVTNFYLVKETPNYLSFSNFSMFFFLYFLGQKNLK